MSEKNELDAGKISAGEILYLQIKSQSDLPDVVKLNFVNGKGRAKTEAFYRELNEFVKDMPVKNSDIFPLFECALRSECGQKSCRIMNSVSLHKNFNLSKKQLFVFLYDFNEVVKKSEMKLIYDEFRNILIKNFS